MVNSAKRVEGMTPLTGRNGEIFLCNAYILPVGAESSCLGRQGGRSFVKLNTLRFG